MKTTLRAAITLIVSILTPLFAQAPAEPGPNKIAQQAGFIAIGTMQFNNGQWLFTATESLKGQSTVGVAKTVTIPAEAGFAAWMEQSVAQNPTILVGTYNTATGVITLPHLKHSVWPQGTFPDYFADKTVAGCKDFIQKAHSD